MKLSNLLDSLKLDVIDFMSVDVEGLDFEVLSSNNWNKYRPKVIITECFTGGIESLCTNKIYKLMNDVGYTFFCNSPTNAVYIENLFIKERFI